MGIRKLCFKLLISYDENEAIICKQLVVIQRSKSAFDAVIKHSGRENNWNFDFMSSHDFNVNE